MADFKTPSHLSAPSRAWMATILEQVGEAGTETDHKLLILAAEALDTAATARRLVSREGICVTDRFGAPKPHPAVAILRDARNSFSRIVAQLGLDVHEEPPQEGYRGRNSRLYKGGPAR
jgi:P27 family predicted phage terminase small subunit